MPQSISAVFIHLTFGTKDREPWIRTSIAQGLYAYGTATMKNAGCPALAMNGMADHMHVLFLLSRVKTLAEVVENLKTSTSKWIKTKGPEYRGFHWQTGYAAFSVSRSNVNRVTRYIQDQVKHHRGRSFKDELLTLLERHNVEFDERFLWD